MDACQGKNAVDREQCVVDRKTGREKQKTEKQGNREP
jgi:hypothetical protein